MAAAGTADGGSCPSGKASDTPDAPAAKAGAEEDAEARALREEEEATPEERMAWLKARGVLIEDFRKKPEPPPAAAAATSQAARFSYVFLPADDALDPEERTAVAGAGDVLPELLGPSFAGKVDDEALKRTAASHGQSVGLEAMRQAAARGGAEAFRVAAPTEANGRQAVYIYLDECSALKGLSRNRRASELARVCGFPAECEFRGDVFVGRVRWTQDGNRNESFALKDLHPGAEWQRRAPLENLEFQKAVQPDAHEDAQAAALRRPELAVGAGEGYTWQDSEEDVEISLILDDPRAKKVAVSFRRNAVEVTSPIKLTLRLFADVDTESCTWSYCPEGVRLTLPKAKEARWPRLLRD